MRRNELDRRADDEVSRLFFSPQDEVMEERKLLERSMTIDHLQTMLRQECSEAYQCSSKYLTLETDHEDAVNDEWRRKICDWCYEVIDHYNFDREVVCIALNYLDRFVTSLSPQTVNRRQFQLLAVTSLYLSIKLHGDSCAFDGKSRKRFQVRIDAFVELSRGLFTARMIEEMEGALLQALEWRVNPPTAAGFVSSLVALLPPDEVHNGAVHDYLYDAARYHVELAVCCSELALNHKPSVVAFASILNTMDALDVTSLPVQVRSTFAARVVAQSSSLRLDSREVLQAREYLRHICPQPVEFDPPSSIRQPASPTGVNLISMDGSGTKKASPTSVCDGDMHHRSSTPTASNTSEPYNRRHDNRRRRKRVIQ